MKQSCNGPASWSLLRNSFRATLCFLVLSASFCARGGELGDLLQETLHHPQVAVAAKQVAAAQAQKEAAAGRYLGSAILSTGWHRYDSLRVVGSYAPTTVPPPLLADKITQTGMSYSLPVDLFGAISANNERARHDLAVAKLVERQQILYKLHQASSAYVGLQALMTQREALQLSRRRVEAAYQRIRKEVELGKTAGVQARYAESELMRIAADEEVLAGSIRQAQADLEEVSGRSKFIPTAEVVRVPAWENLNTNLPSQIAQSRAASAYAQASEARRALLPSVALDASYFRSGAAANNNGHRDTWVFGIVLNLPLGVSAYKQAAAQRFNSEAAEQQSEAVRRDTERQIVSLRSSYESAVAEALAMDNEVVYREQVAIVEQEMQRLGNQTLENLFSHQRDLLNARYRLAQAQARAAIAWSAIQVIAGPPAATYIASIDSASPLSGTLK